MRKVESEVEEGGWLSLKGRPGVVRLWWEVGRRLRKFFDDLDVGPEDDRQFVWRAIYDHAGSLAPGPLGTRAERYANSHFNYCYRLGKYGWPLVRAVGDWTSWVEIFDSDRVRSDERMADWLVDRVGSDDPRWRSFTDRQQMAWFRPLLKAIRARFHNRDSTGLTQRELYEELDDIFDALSEDAARLV